MNPETVMRKLKDLQTVCGRLHVWTFSPFNTVEFSRMDDYVVAWYSVRSRGVIVHAYPEISGAQVDQLRIQILEAIPGYIPVITAEYKKMMRPRLKQIKQELTGYASGTCPGLERYAASLRKELEALEG